MKTGTMKQWVLGLWIVVFLTGCIGIDPEQYNVEVIVNPDLSGKFLLESQFTKYDLDSYASTNELSSADAVIYSIADELAGLFEWTFPYETFAREDGDYIWVQMLTEFRGEEEFCGIIPAEDPEEEARITEQVGEQNILPCILQVSSTPYSDLFLYQSTIYPNGNPGRFGLVLPGYVAETNGAPYGTVGIVWSFNADTLVVPMYTITAGMTDFRLNVDVDMNGEDTSSLVITATVPQEVASAAKAMYPSTDDPFTALGERMAKGLRLSGYTISTNEVGSDVTISIEMTGLTSEELQNALTNSGLMTDVSAASTSTFIKSQYSFSGNLAPWKEGTGYPSSIILTVNVPGQTEPQSFTADESQQAVLVSGESTNWMGILGIGVAFILVLIGGGVLVVSVILIRRKQS